MSGTVDGECTCTWAKVWHSTPVPGVEERSWTITDYSVDCIHHHRIARAIAWATPEVPGD